MAKSYRIVARCDSYTSARHFSPKAEDVIERNEGSNIPTKWAIARSLSLRDARTKLLQMAAYDLEYPVDNWGVAVRHPNEDKEVECYRTREDGTRAYRKDKVTYEIEEEEDYTGLLGQYNYSTGNSGTYRWNTYKCINFQKDGKTALFRNHTEARNYAIWAGLDLDTTAYFHVDLDGCKLNGTPNRDAYVVVTPDDYDSIIQVKDE